jgi:hypothetical protein
MRPPGRSTAAGWLALPGVLVAVLLLGQHLDKPFTIDDPMFLRQAQHLLIDPLHPAAFDYVWMSDVERLSKTMPTGPVMPYLMVAAVKADRPERVAHLVQLLLLAAGIAATVSLALRLRLGRIAAAGAGVVVAASPAVIAMTATAMPDLPAMAFGVIALERIHAFRDDRRWHQGAAAAIALVLAALSRSHLMGLFAIGIMAALGDRLFQPRSWWGMLVPWGAPIVAAVGLLAAALHVTHDPQPDSASILDAVRGLVGSGATASNVIAFAGHWVLTLPLALPWMAIHWRRIVRGRIIWATIPGAAALLLANQSGQWRWMAPVAGIGAAVVGDILIDAVSRRDAVQAMLGAWLLLPLPAMVYLHLPCKYAVAAAPAVALLVARELRARPSRGAVLASAAALVLGGALSVAIVRADARLAAPGRRAAQQLIAPAVAEGKKVWFAGHWGFQWYAENAGAIALANGRPAPAAGDLLVVSTASWPPQDLVNKVKAKTLLTTIQDRRPGGRIMQDGAGFYSNFWGYLPWTWSDLPSDRIELWRVD